jgi:hypothetical protein
VRAFYAALAGRRFDEASSLLDPSASGQVEPGGVRGLASTLRSVTFARAATATRTSSRATVAIATTAVHSDYTAHCTGTVQLIGGAGAWKVHRFGVQCTR